MKSFTITFLFLIGFSATSQNVWIADNRPTAPTGAHVFASVAEAITAASTGDIIHVIPSQFSYGNFTINKDSLTFFGIGYNPDKEQPSVTTAGTVIIDNNRFGIRISGINMGQLTLGSSSAGSVGNIFIENGEIDHITGNVCCTATNLSNIIIRNCVIGKDFTGSEQAIQMESTYVNSTSIVIANNIIMGSSSTSSGGYGSISVTDAIIKNNLFLGNNASDFAFNNVITSTISNNIFLGRRPVTDAVGGDVINSTFNSNISFGNTNNSFPIGSSGNTGDSVLVNTDPLLVNVLIVDDWDFAFDPNPDTGSPALNAGNDGGDIGVSGGTIPYSLTGTPLPVIKVLRVPEIIKEGTDLNATIEAKGN
jgi:hypothetical protein